MQCTKTLITGTFIDEITYDIPASNWTDEQWKKDLDHMKEIGIDTLVFIRGGMYSKSIFPSRVLGTEHREDFAGMIISEAEKRDMQVFFGLYISDLDWHHGDAQREIDINQAFAQEVWTRYGHSPAFAGWYIPQETCCDELNITQIIQGLGRICKGLAPHKPILLSPFFGSQRGITPQQHYEEWDRIFAKTSQYVDICAFQDGSAPIEEMEEFFKVTAQLCEKYNIRHWVNAETFERDVRQLYFPIPFQDLKQKLEMHQAYAEKIITFEFSHFLSPQSIFVSAQNLNRLYRQHYKI